MLTLTTTCGCTFEAKPVGEATGWRVELQGITVVCPHGQTVGFTDNLRQAKQPSLPRS